MNVEEAKGRADVWRGPKFKGPDTYLTAEGYPLGTTCWYVHVEVDGWIQTAAADTPEEAEEKAVRIVEREAR